MRRSCSAKSFRVRPGRHPRASPIPKHGPIIPLRIWLVWRATSGDGRPARRLGSLPARGQRPLHRLLWRRLAGRLERHTLISASVRRCVCLTRLTLCRRLLTARHSRTILQRSHKTPMSLLLSPSSPLPLHRPRPFTLEENLVATVLCRPVDDGSCLSRPRCESQRLLMSMFLSHAPPSVH
jgi:hypothetical protein